MKVDFWKINSRPPGLAFETQGSEGQANYWPDVLGCGAATPGFFVSERILMDLQNAGIPYLRATEIPSNEPYPRKLRGVPPPKYHVLEAIRGILHDYDAMGVPVDSNGRPVYIGNKPFPKHVCRLSSWNNNDLFSYTDVIWTLTIMCTEKVVNLAKEKKWTNIEFKPVLTVE